MSLNWIRPVLNRVATSVICMAAFVIAPAALAEEIVVKNDSVTDFGQAVIVGDFVAGEHAGVRLTSPCNGAIVAVQILWLEGTPGHLPSLEQAIHIYNGATFPTPGAELQIMEGPVLTPGGYNEFRYLDEQQTMPLNVPVTQGQQFYVTLEFANPTNVGNGGPSVVRDMNGCQSGKNVLFAIPGGWMNFCLYLTGDLAIRAVIDCPGATGACCYANGSCANDVEEDDCIAEYGATWHEGMTCGEISCTPRGACCRAGGCLSLVSPANCQAIGGTYAGHGTNCDDQVCVAGACCIEDTGECVLNFGFQCEAIGGNFLGPGTTCTPNPCPQPFGACCFGEFCIEDQTEAACTGSGGDWGGAWTTCADDNSNGVADVCESDPCAGVVFTPGDVDDSGFVDGLDIQAFVVEFLSPTPPSVAFCAANMCAANTALDEDDLVAFVACLLDPGSCASPMCP